MSTKIKVEVGQVWKKGKYEATITRVVKKPRYDDPYCNARIGTNTFNTTTWNYLTEEGYPSGWGLGWKLKSAKSACPHDCCNGYKQKKKK